MTYKQIAEESGYSFSTIQAVKCGCRPVSQRLESFITQKLLLERHNEAVELVIQVCGEEEPQENGEAES